MKRFVFISILLFSSVGFCLPDYYNLPSSATDIKDTLFLILDSYHLPQEQTSDQLLSECIKKTCFRHSSVGYKKARQFLFGYLFLEGTTYSNYSLMTAYCQIEVTNQELSPRDPLAPMTIPDPSVINAEHTWPQSKFSKKFPEDLQKSDLHILLPEFANVNTQRSNHPFGYVEKLTSSLCPGSALGKSTSGRTVFEPHDSIKGNVARALFYFSVRYKIAIDSEQESTLREWHELDPTDSNEDLHNEEVFKIQKNRNPFIDNPAWVAQIKDF